MKKILFFLLTFIEIISVNAQIPTMADTTINGLHYTSQFNGNILFNYKDSTSTMYFKTVVVVPATSDTIYYGETQATINLTAIPAVTNSIVSNTVMINKFSKAVKKKMNKYLIKQ